MFWLLGHTNRKKHPRSQRVLCGPTTKMLMDSPQNDAGNIWDRCNITQRRTNCCWQCCAKRWAQEATRLGGANPTQISLNRAIASASVGRPQETNGLADSTKCRVHLVRNKTRSVCSEPTCPFVKGVAGEQTRHQHHTKAHPNIRSVEGAAGERNRPSCTLMDQRA